ncbi:Microtubule binding/Kinesin motor domain containing protein, putative [Angomonas deanei]|uniref:Kinesin-like protein n=1 Tax=Angomonas deanei TaxID=59799 RepID=A0A7G2CH53_9TRYP|nr:Microtubule binding/Kinesin motor domain containing protein, putative [Angomonas deanei]
MTQSSVEVLVRIRPIRSELRESKVAWDSLSSTSLREKSNSDAIFTFDEVFPTDCTTEELYQRRIQKSVVRRVSQGYNGTIFAYGQTGSGKSFTMLGDGSRSVGITTLCVTDLFAALSLQGSNTGRISSPLVSSNSSVEVSVSVLEIYNENLRDLLCDGEKKPPLSIRDGPNGVFVYNAVRRRVHSVEECLQVIRKGTASRMSAATFMNEQSSRSHCIVSVHIERTIVVNEEDNQSSSSDSESTSVSQDDTSSSPVNGRNLKKKLVSTLHLVDLAGSERVAKTGTTGVRMTEGGHINKSLTTLTNVINRLTEISNQTTATSAPRNTFVPYRDSRLTHLLKTAIGGNSYTVVICCISPALENVDESRSTLQFASRAKAIKNNVSLNEVVDNVKVKNRLLEMEVRRLKKLLVAQTIYNWSKDVKIKNLKEAVTLVGGSAKSNTNTPPAGGTAHLSDVYEQQQLIIDQLTSEKEALQEMCDALVSDGGGQKTTQADLQDMEEMLQESEKEKESLEAALQELQQHCTAIEGENKKRLTRIAALEKKNKELEELLETAEDESESLQGELVFLKEQLDNTQQRLVESGKGDAYLEELAKLHVSYQKLQYDYSQLQQMHGALTKQSTCTAPSQGSPPIRRQR